MGLGSPRPHPHSPDQPIIDSGVGGENNDESGGEGRMGKLWAGGLIHSLAQAAQRASALARYAPATMALAEICLFSI